MSILLTISFVFQISICQCVRLNLNSEKSNHAWTATGNHENGCEYFRISSSFLMHYCLISCLENWKFYALGISILD
jgi:hypothetical protein